MAIKGLGTINYEERTKDTDYKKRLNKVMTEKAFSLSNMRIPETSYRRPANAYGKCSPPASLKTRSAQRFFLFLFADPG